MMKVLITTDWYKPAVNGVVTSVLNLCEGLQKLGCEVRILTLSGDRHSRKEGNVTYIGSAGAGKIYPGARFMVTSGHKYIKDLENWCPDIVHSQCEFFTYFLAKRVSKACGCPIVHTYHTIYEDYTKYFCPNEKIGRFLAAVYSKMIIRTADEVIVPTEKIRSFLEYYGVATPVAVVPSGLKLDQFGMADSAKTEDIKKRLGITGSEKVIVYLGRLAKEKNISELLNYVGAQDDASLRLLIVGDEPYRRDLQEQAETHNIADKVIFAGMVKPDEVADYYALGRIFVSASQSETQGLTYIEAMASGLPLLCRADECLHGVVQNGLTGYTYSSLDDFSSKLSMMIGNPDLTEHMGIRARDAVFGRYSEIEFAKGVLKVYIRAMIRNRMNSPAVPQSADL